jgi:hypothetical protein
MHKAALVAIAIAVLAADCVGAQDIAGLEDCTKTNGLDKRTGCFQSNIEVLSKMIMKNAADAQQKLNAANADIATLQRTLADLRTRIEGLEKNVKKPDSKQ